MKHSTIAVDLATSVFQVAVSHRAGQVSLERLLPAQPPVQEGPQPRTDLLGARHRHRPRCGTAREGRGHVVLDRQSCRLRSHS